MNKKCPNLSLAFYAAGGISELKAAKKHPEKTIKIEGNEISGNENMMGGKDKSWRKFCIRLHKKHDDGKQHIIQG